MLSRRDKLLVRPWQQKKFENHRRKVLSALPAIDDKPPAFYDHVSTKKKRQQLEKERITKIEKDNLTLLRKLNYIRKTSRVDNHWIIPQPDFLNRETIFEEPVKSKRRDKTAGISSAPITKKWRCLACNPHYVPPKPVIPEERVPWSPVKPPVSKKRSQSVPLPKATPTIVEDLENVSAASKEKTSIRSKSCKAKMYKTPEKRKSEKNEYQNFSHGLVLSRGSLELVINFPTDTLVKIHDVFSEKVLLGKTCSCKAMMNCN